MKDRYAAIRPFPTTGHAVRPLVACAVALLALLVAGPVGAEITPAPSAATPGLPDADGWTGSYSYVRVLEGSATLIQGDNGDREQLQVNQPVLVGDRIWVAPRSRVEVVLSDRNLLRIDAGSEVVFDALAGSPDRQDPLTVLRVPQGNVQLVVVSDFLGDGLPRIDTPNATVYAYDVGTMRLTTDHEDWTEVLAREGSAEIVTRNGSFLLDEGDEALVEGEHEPHESVRTAGRLDSLELWGERLDREARYAAAPYVDDSLQYEAATLDRYGSWVTIDGRQAWRPRVAADWRPYWNGRWSHSPLGYVWVSYEPWGWVPYHYGTWDYVPGYGWSWFPGVNFAPAWVYWYWTDVYVGWIPAGYYTHFYHPLMDAGVSFRWGLYGWTGGYWGAYHDWNFCDLRYFGNGRQHHHVYRGDRFADHSGYAVPRRGILTTDTRGLDHVSARRGEGIIETLARRTRPGVDSKLPDATDFVARNKAIGRDLRNRIVVDRKTSDGKQIRSMVADEIPQKGAGIRTAPGDLARSRRDVRDDAADRARSVESLRRGLPTASGDTSADRGRSAGDRDAGIRRMLPSRGTTANQTRSVDASPSAPKGDRSDRADEIRRTLPETPRSATRDRSGAEAGASWRTRTPVVPDRTPDRTGTRDGAIHRIDPQRIERVRSKSPRVDRSRTDRSSGSVDRTPVPRRVIEGVRSSPRSSTRDRSSSSSTRERSGTSTRTRSSSPPPRRSSSASSRSHSSRTRSTVSHRSSSSSRGSSGARSRSSSSSHRSSGAKSSRSKSRGKPPA